jgi:hypothetical protein
VASSTTQPALSARTATAGVPPPRPLLRAPPQVVSRFRSEDERRAAAKLSSDVIERVVHAGVEGAARRLEWLEDALAGFQIRCALGL